jgi:hypothetical protein
MGVRALLRTRLLQWQCSLPYSDACMFVLVSDMNGHVAQKQLVQRDGVSRYKNLTYPSSSNLFHYFQPSAFNVLYSLAALYNLLFQIHSQVIFCIYNGPLQLPRLPATHL